MNLPKTTSQNPLSRRRFLQLAAVAGGATAAPFVVSRAMDGSTTAAAPPAEDGSSTDVGHPAVDAGEDDPPVPAPSGDGPVLVVIHLDGGNDGLNTVVPVSDSRYESLRGAGIAPVEALSPLDSDFALASMPYLAERWGSSELAIVHGVGVPDGSLSHFAAGDVWESGSLGASLTSGFLGRAVEHLYGVDADPLTGVCAGSFSRALQGDAWSPFTLPSGAALPWSAEFVERNPGVVAGLEHLATASLTGLGGEVIESHSVLRDVGERIDAARPDDDQPGAGRAERGVAQDLALVADAINAGLPTAVFHLRHGGFDTHANQLASHPGLLLGLDEAIAAFHGRLGTNRDRVVVMTWTEFGRRVAFNGSGTDHGTSSIGFVLGSSVAGGHYGEPPELGSLDRAGNLPVTTDFRDYIAGVCGGVLGVPADVIAEANDPVEVLV